MGEEISPLDATDASFCAQIPLNETGGQIDGVVTPR
jgi:hypothetical protein